MAVYFCKLITIECTSAVEAKIKAFINTALEDVTFQSFTPYWKETSCGELSFSFSADKSLHEIQSLFADRWQEDVADARWSSIFCPSTTFIWLGQ